MSFIKISPVTPAATTGVATARLFAGAGTTAKETSGLSMLLGYDTSDTTEGSGLGVDTGGFAAKDMDAIFWWYWYFGG
jgi:hypothetical protein